MCGRPGGGGVKEREIGCGGGPGGGVRCEASECQSLMTFCYAGECVFSSDNVDYMTIGSLSIADQ